MLIHPSLLVLLRLLLGSLRLGRNRRDLPAQSTRKITLHDHRLQLAPQLGNRLRDPLHGQPGRRQRRSRRKGLFHLGQFLLCLHWLCVGDDL